MIKSYFTGTCEPNQDGGIMAYGGVIYYHEVKIHEISYLYKRKDNMASNNIAEYCGCISVLKYLIAHIKTEEEIYIFGDSKLVINQMNGDWMIKSGKYAEYAVKALALLDKFKEKPEFEWIPAERNQEADILSRKNYHGKRYYV